MAEMFFLFSLLSVLLISGRLPSGLLEGPLVGSWPQVQWFLPGALNLRVGRLWPRTAGLCGQMVWFRGILNRVILFSISSRRGWRPTGRITFISLKDKDGTEKCTHSGAETRFTVCLEELNSAVSTEKVVFWDLTKPLLTHIPSIYHKKSTSFRRC